MWRGARVKRGIIDVKLTMLSMLADEAGVPLNNLSSLVMELFLETNQTWSPGHAHDKMLKFIEKWRLPPLLTLIDDWLPYLDLTPEELDALRAEAAEEAIFLLREVERGPERERLLLNIQTQGWDARAVRLSIQAAQIQQGIDPLRLIQLEDAHKVLMTPHPSMTRYIEMRREAFRLKRQYFWT